MSEAKLPIPQHFEPERVGEVWRVDYEARAREARAWAAEHEIRPASEDERRIALVLVDVQNTFCLPEFELFVAGRSGKGAVEDSQRLCRFLYENLHRVTRIFPTMDTHQPIQIFHSLFLVDGDGNHPDPMTVVTVEDVEQGRWRFNRAAAATLGIDPDDGQRHLEHYVRELAENEKYDLLIWPFHAMLGGIGHALVSAVEEAVFFHSVARFSQPDVQVKGSHPLTEHYSALGPEVTEGPDGEPLVGKNERFVEKLLAHDAVIIAGQAKSHCVAWTIDDLLRDVREGDPSLAEKVYLLEDCTSPVVVPDVVDFTEEADAAFERFAEAGMHVVRSTDPIASWPGIGVPA